VTSIRFDHRQFVSAVRGRLPRLIRYGVVSIGVTLFSLVILTSLVATGTASPGWANLLATIAGIGPSFELNRRWVWNSVGRPRAAQVVPFAAMSFVGLVLSSITVTVTAWWTEAAGFTDAARAVVAAVASLSAFGAVWLGQFVVCDRRLFAARGSAGVAASRHPCDEPGELTRQPTAGVGPRGHDREHVEHLGINE